MTATADAAKSGGSLLVPVLSEHWDEPDSFTIDGYTATVATRRSTRPWACTRTKSLRW